MYKNSEKINLSNWRNLYQCKMIRRGEPNPLGEVDESKYIYGICRCQVDYGYGMTILPIDNLTNHEKETGKCCMHCNKYDIDCIINLYRKKEIENDGYRKRDSFKNGY